MLYTAMAQTGSLPQPTEEPAEPYFYDTAGSWAEDYIIPAARLGLITGSDAGYFSPERPITRQEMTVILDRCLDLPDENGLGFSDDGDIALWALEAAARTSAAGLFQGSGGRLMPLATSTRKENSYAETHCRTAVCSGSAGRCRFLYRPGACAEPQSHAHSHGYGCAHTHTYSYSLAIPHAGAHPNSPCL